MLISIPMLSFSQKLIDTHGYIRFFSEAPLEDIEAINEEALGAMNTNTGDVAVSIKMRDFHFDKSLMEEHFNENYVESEKFPKATLVGKIMNFTAENLGNLKDSIQYDMKGKLTIHGVTKDVTLPLVFTRDGKRLNVQSVFMVEVAEYDIEIPSIVFQNIAEKVEVTAKFSFQYEPNN